MQETKHQITTVQKDRITRCLSDIRRRINYQKGSVLDPDLTIAALEAVLGGQSLSPSKFAQPLSPIPYDYQKIYKIHPHHKQPIAKYLAGIRELINSGNKLNVRPEDAITALEAVALARIALEAGQIVVVPQSAEANPYEADEFLFNTLPQEVLSLPVSEVVQRDLTAYWLLEIHLIETIEDLLQLTYVELCHLLGARGSTQVKQMPVEQAQAIVSELAWRGWHLTRLDKTQPIPNDRWVLMGDSIERDSFPILLFSRLDKTKIEWLFGKFGHTNIKVLKDLGITTIGQLLTLTPSQLMDLLGTHPSLREHSPRSEHRGIINRVHMVELSLAPEPE